MSVFLTYWQADPIALAALMLLAFTYWYIHRRSSVGPYGPFIAATALLALCFFSPLAVLSGHYLFSAHMVVHVLLLLVAAPLLVVSLSGSALQYNGHVIRFSRLLQRRPVLGWAAGVGIMWLWHIPALFNSMMSAGHMHDNGFHWLHALESGSLIVSGMLFGWPLVTPVKQCRIAPLSGVVYLFTACTACSLLGLLITFAPAGLYRHYLSMNDTYGLNTLITAEWGISRLADQQMAGLIMWVPCCLIYVIYALWLLGKWMNEKNTGGVYAVQNR